MSYPDPFATARACMIEEQLTARGINAPNVLDAINRVPRERFVDLGPDEAYADRAWAIDCEQTISQPYIVGLMTQALELSGNEHVLEVGTGSGYQAAILGLLARDVITIERHAELATRAMETLDALGINNVTCVIGDGTQGWSPSAPYDRIIVTAGAEKVPPPLLTQLAENGILIIPLGPPDNQVLYALRKQGDRLQSTSLSPCRFVPLIPDR